MKYKINLIDLLVDKPSAGCVRTTDLEALSLAFGVLKKGLRREVDSELQRSISQTTDRRIAMLSDCAVLLELIHQLDYVIKRIADEDKKSIINTANQLRGDRR